MQYNSLFFIPLKQLITCSVHRHRGEMHLWPLAGSFLWFVSYGSTIPSHSWSVDTWLKSYWEGQFNVSTNMAVLATLTTIYHIWF